MGGGQASWDLFASQGGRSRTVDGVGESGRSRTITLGRGESGRLRTTPSQGPVAMIG